MLGSKLYSTFDPRALGDCALWLDAADRNTLTLSGSNVTRWSDKSGYNRHADASSNAPAVDSNGGLYFSNSFYVTPLTGDPTNETAFVVFNTSNSGMLVGGYSSGRQIGLQNSNTIGLLKAGVAWGPQATFTTGVRQVVTTQTSSSATSSLVNGGSNSATGSGFTYTSSNVTTLGREGGTSFPYIGYVYEVILYNSILTAGQCRQVEGYLTKKWSFGNVGSNVIVSAPLTPLALPNLALWLDATDASSIDLSGTSVTQWRDKSGSNNHAVGAGSALPTVTANFANGLAGIRGASNTYMSNTTMSVPLSNRTAFLVCSTYSTSSPTLGIAQLGTVPNGVAHGVDGLNTAPYQNQGGAQFGWIYRYFSGGGYYKQWSCNNFASATTTPLGVYAETVSNLVHSPYVNGGEAGSTTFSAAPTDCSGYYLGARYDTNAVQFGYPATFGEFIVYRGALTDAQRRQIEAYLISKWNIPRTFITLPTGHPYRSAPPVLRAFNPTDIDGCSLWLDAADNATLTLSGSNITAWADKSGFGYNATATGNISNTGRINGLQAATFGTNAYTYFRGAASNTGTTLTAFAVFSMSSTAQNFARILGFQDSSVNLTDYNSVSYATAISRWGGGTTVTGARNGTQLSSITVSYDTPLMACTQFSGSNHTMFSNSTAGTSQSNSGSFAYSNYYIGTTKGAEDVVWFTGTIGEVIAYNASLTTAQRQQVETYLATKWGLRGSTPSGHPTRFSPALVPQFTPLAPGTCTFWLDAADSSTFTLSGSNVTQWNDKSGGGYNVTQSTTSNQPLLGTSNTVTFQNSRYFNIPQAAINNASNYSIILAVNLVSASNYIFVKQHNGVNTYNVLTTTFSTPGANFGTSNYLYWRTSNAGSQANSGQSVGTGLQLLEILYDGSNVTMYKNGTLLSTTAATGGTANIANVTNATNFTLGAWDAGGLVYATATNFQLGELLFFNTRLSDYQRWQLEAALAKKWGLTGSLSSNNPYRNNPPI